ncbi:MAG: hypothetical protein ABJG86_19250 [Nitratireductor sp.]|uniref:hypothetical protein n=1 Tax=Alphaproteobacteria TaxID=28211 RepID=UPI003265C5C6
MDHISTEESRALGRRRARMNWVVFSLLAAFVVAVFVLSFTHIQGESNPPEAAAGSE